MKITTFILLISIMTVSAATNAQQVTLRTKQASLQQVLDQVGQQTGFNVFYSQELLSKAIPVTVDLKNTKLDDAMTAILEGQPLTFKIENQTVIVKEKEASFLDKVKAFIAAIDVTGRVTDENNQPLAGATVKTKDNNFSTSTDLNGFFTLKNVQPGTPIIVSYIGYEITEVSAAANVGQIKLKVATSVLDQVQIEAYGKTSKRLATGNIGTVTAKDIEKQPITNPLLSLQGRIPGVIITQSSGNAGTGVKIEIRGQNYLTTLSGNDPLFIVDGIPYPSQVLSGAQGLSNILGFSGTGTTSTGSPLTFINPNDIESISILKDADATSIYGTRAANGAVVITTKKRECGSSSGIS